jgi:hypothetical protein
MIQKTKSPEDVSLGVGGRMNRTGIDASPVHGREMIEGAAGEQAGAGQAKEIRRAYMEESEPIGTIPPPTSMKGAASAVKEALGGARATVLIDKLAERFAFERTGVRLYDALIGKHDGFGGFEGGPSRDDLSRFRDEELRHVTVLKECIEALGADATAVTPSADLAGVEGSGVGQVLADPRTTLAQGLHAILVAEVADKAGWELLIQLASELGQDEVVERLVPCEREEREHLKSVMRWVGAHARVTART